MRSNPPSALVRLSIELGLGSEPSATLEALTNVYRWVDEQVQERSAGLDLPCHAGCDACCHEAVFLSAPEFLGVAADLLTRWAAPERRAVVERMRALAARFEDELELLETIPAGEERDEVAARVKFRCPLLADDGRCSVYAARELNARTFGASWDPQRSAPFGCSLTHERLRVLPAAAAPSMMDARVARRRLVEAVPSTERVHVYPWWFDRYGDHLL